MTKAGRQRLFKTWMKEGYDLHVEGRLDGLAWNKWSWLCYKFQDEEITVEQLIAELIRIEEKHNVR